LNNRIPFYSFAIFFGAGSNFLFFLFSAVALDSVRFSEIAYFLTIFSIFLFISNHVVEPFIFSIRCRSDSDSLEKISSLVGCFCFFSFLCISALFTFTTYHSTADWFSFILLFFTVVMISFSGVWLTRLRFEGRSDSVVWLNNILRPSLLYFSAIGFWFFTLPLELAYLISFCVLGLFGFGAEFRRRSKFFWGLLRLRPGIILVQDLLNFGCAPLALSVVPQIDVLVVNYLFGAEAVGVYKLAVTISLLALVPLAGGTILVSKEMVGLSRQRVGLGLVGRLRRICLLCLIGSVSIYLASVGCVWLLVESAIISFEGLFRLTLILGMGMVAIGFTGFNFFVLQTFGSGEGFIKLICYWWVFHLILSVGFGSVFGLVGFAVGACAGMVMLSCLVSERVHSLWGVNFGFFPVR